MQPTQAKKEDLLHRPIEQSPEEKNTRLSAGPVILAGTLGLPEGAEELMLFAHGSGSSRHSPRNGFVAHMLRDRGLGMLK